jgi:hypothetical protein
MKNKSLLLLGKALQALMKLGAIKEVAEIIDLMAENPAKLTEPQDDTEK